MPAISLSLQPPFSTAREGPTCLVRIAVSCCKVLPYSYQSAFFKKRESAIEVALPSAAVHVYTLTHLHTNVHAYRQIAAPRYAQVSHYSRSHSHSCPRTHVRTYAPRVPILRMSLFAVKCVMHHHQLQCGAAAHVTYRALRGKMFSQQQLALRRTRLSVQLLQQASCRLLTFHP